MLQPDRLGFNRNFLAVKHANRRHTLDRRIPDQATLEREVKAWETQRNASPALVKWRFTTADARIKLKRLYPSQQR
ncbi:MAG: hypothetical protein U1F76_23605 [Candidatus Competibacteraceae bacterium]